MVKVDENKEVFMFSFFYLLLSLGIKFEETSAIFRLRILSIIIKVHKSEVVMFGFFHSVQPSGKVYRNFSYF